jgi:hypothetical protein
MTAPLLGGTTLAQLASPGGYNIDEILQGAVNEMASGRNIVDVVAPNFLGSSRRIFKLTWRLITLAEYQDIHDEYWAMVTDSSSIFTSPEGVAIDVQPSKNVGVKVETVKLGNGDFRYNVSCEFQEYG